MKILALNGSFRKNGNTEILLKQALMGGESEGAEVEILRLTDCKIKPCRGCGLCLFKENVCQEKDDDVNFIFSKIEECDGMIIGSPCYFLETTAVIKQLVDRCWILGHEIRKPPKPATVIIPYATNGWIPYIMVQPNILLNLLGMKKINQAAFLVQGISEIVLDQDSMDLAYYLGKELSMAIRKKDYTYRGEPGICPVCHDWNLRILKDYATVECPLCGIRGSVSAIEGKINVKFAEKDLAKARFGAKEIYNHYTYHIKPSRDFFLRTKEERKIRAQRYREYLPT